MREALGIVGLVCALLSCNPPENDPGQNGQTGPQGPPGPQGPAGPGAATSGTRLKVRYVVGEDGLKVPLARSLGPNPQVSNLAPASAGEFWDTKRNEACVLLPDELGQLRCLPSGVAGVEIVAPINGAFFDAACQIPFFAANECVPKYGLEAVKALDCDQRGGRRYRVYALAPMPITEYYRQDGVKCTREPLAVTAYRGTPITPTEFASLKIEQGQ